MMDLNEWKAAENAPVPTPLAELLRINRPDNYWYLASPYSKYPRGMEAAYEDICLITGKLLQLGVTVFSPIAHSHSVAEVCGNLAKDDHDFWLRHDWPLVHNSMGLIVAKMDSWDTSFGVGEEIKWVSSAGKPIVYLAPEELGIHNGLVYVGGSN